VALKLREGEAMDPTILLACIRHLADFGFDRFYGGFRTLCQVTHSSSVSG
jgi:hypothetical protein